MLKLKTIAEGCDMIFFSRSVGIKVDLFGPFVPVAKYSLLLLFKKKVFFSLYFWGPGLLNDLGRRI